MKKFTPRGQKTLLPHGSLPESISPYLIEQMEQTGGMNSPLAKQFIAQPKIEQKNYSKIRLDPLIEGKNEVAPGIIYKYKGKINKQGKILYYGRALWTISRYCATYCRFCTRGRLVGLPSINPSKQTAKNPLELKSNETLTQKSYLSDQDIDTTVNFLKQHREINEVILSGGDPLVVPEAYFRKIINKLTSMQSSPKHEAGQLDFIRIHTRAPITNPFTIKDWHINELKKIHNPIIVLHINHPVEITPEVLAIAQRLKHEANATLLSQSVLLKGVNDSVETLSELFLKLAKNGIRPYYLHHNDPVYWAAHFTVPIKRAIKIWQALRPRLSGICATAKFVIDTPYGYGKVPFPEAGWEVDYSHFHDFHKVKHQLR